MMTSMHAEPSELVDQGRAALRADDATAARRAFVAAHDHGDDEPVAVPGNVEPAGRLPMCQAQARHERSPGRRE